MKRLLLGVLLVCAAVAFVAFSGGKLRLPWHRAYVPSPSSVAAGQGRLRFDGLYQGATGAGTSVFLRFYPEGQAVIMSAPSPSVDQAAGLIDRRRPDLARGTYHLHEASVSLVATNPSGSIDGEGSIGQESLVCLIHSHVTGGQEPIKFTFHPASFLSD